MDSVYRRNPDVIFRKIADEFVLVPIRQKAVDLKSIFTLNETGAFIWGFCDGSTSVSQIKDKLIEQFEVEPRQAQDDIRQIVSHLEGLGLLQKK
jgi:hypothetical protein